MKEIALDYIVSVWNADGTHSEHLILAKNLQEAENKANKIYPKKAITVKKA